MTTVAPEPIRSSRGTRPASRVARGLLLALAVVGTLGSVASTG